MGNRANQAIIGAFVLGAVLLAVGGVVLLSGDRLLRPSQTLVAYFDGSLDGLEIGAPVTFNGVKIGSVSDLRVVIDDDGSIRTPVFFKVYGKRLRDGHGDKRGTDVLDRESLITRGLRARLELQSLVTGQLAVALNFFPGTPVRLTGRSKHADEIPTVPSSFEQLTRRLENLPLEALVAQTTRTMQSVEALATTPEVKSVLAKFDRVLNNVDGMVRDARSQVDPLVGSVQVTARATQMTMAEAQRALAEMRAAIAQVTPPATATLAEYQALAQDARQAIARADAQIDAVSTSLQATLAEVHGVLGDDSPVRSDLATALQQMTKAARSLRTLADYLDQHPEALLVGKRQETAR